MQRSTALDEQSLSLKVSLKEGNIAEIKKRTLRTHVTINPRKRCATFAPSMFFEIKKTPGTGPLPAPAQPPPSVPRQTTAPPPLLLHPALGGAGTEALPRLLLEGRTL